MTQVLVILALIGMIVWLIGDVLPNGQVERIGKIITLIAGIVWLAQSVL